MAASAANIQATMRQTRRVGRSCAHSAQTPMMYEAAMKPTNQPPNWVLTPNNPPAATQTAAAVTPRRADGKLDLSGNWGGPANPISGGGARRCGPTQTKVNCNIPMDNFWASIKSFCPPWLKKLFTLGGMAIP